MYTVEKVTEEKEKQLRYDLLFGFNNIVLIFRKKDINFQDRAIFYESLYESSDYYAVYSCSGGNNSVKDFLTILLCGQSVGHLQLEFGDIICLKINNKILTFRYCFNGCPSILDIDRCFIEISDFLTKEKEDLLFRFHSTNKVYDVFTQTEYSIGSLNLKKMLFLTIDSEAFYPERDRNNLIISDYSIYQFFNMEIMKLNPYKQPFFDYSTAIGYLNQINQKKKGINVILLLSLSEMYWLRDCFQLLKLA